MRLNVPPDAAETLREPCPACGNRTLSPLLVIDDVPVHCNILVATADDAIALPRGTLDLACCRHCALVVNVAFDPALLDYDGDYENALHHSPAFASYADDLARGLVERHDLHDRDIVEIGCGDAAFLEQLCALGGSRGYGFDPSYHGPPTRGPVRIDRARYGDRGARRPADFVVCRHVLEHVPDPLDLLRTLRAAVSERPHGAAYVEVPDARWTLEHGGIWDLIYEHYTYFSPPSLRHLFAAAGFSITRLMPAFQEQFLGVEAVVSDVAPPVHDDGEASWLVARAASFVARRAQEIDRWHARLDAAEHVVVWGAGSKGVTFVNTVPAAGSAVEALVDVNPRKQGMHVPGTGHPIVAPDALPAVRPTLVVVMNPVYVEEISQRLGSLGVDAAVVVA